MEEERCNFRQRLEGQLLKFTNVMKGYQYRWVVIDSDVGILEYYEKEDHKRTSKPRGCFSLTFATVCPSDEDSQTFVVNASSGETLRLKAADAKERQLWVNRVRAIAEYQTERATESSTSANFQIPSLLPMKETRPGLTNSSNSDFGSRVGQRSVKSTTRISDQGSEISQSYSPHFVNPCQQLSELFRLLEREGNNLTQDIDNLYSAPSIAFAHGNPEVTEMYRNMLILKATIQAAIKSLKRCVGGFQFNGSPAGACSVETSNGSSSATGVSSSNAQSSLAAVTLTPRAQSVPLWSRNGNNNQGQSVPTPIADMNTTVFYVDPADEVAMPALTDEAELGSVESQKSVILHILSQLKQGRDLTKVVLPTFILERRSLLEMFADYMAHPRLFMDITKGTTSHERMIFFIKWFLTFFHAGKKDKVAKKPYNPIIGETFQCSWRIPEKSSSAVDETGESECSSEQKHELLMSYCAEQVSHHPPVSAFRFICPERQTELTASIHTQSRFQGLTVCVAMLGKVMLKLKEHNEEYIFTLPSCYARSILTVPWIEIGDKITVSCAQSGYSASLNFHTKSVQLNRLHYVTAEVYAPVAAAGGLTGSVNSVSGTSASHQSPVGSQTSSCVFRAEGEWNKSFELTDLITGSKETINLSTLKTDPKYVRPLSKQAPEESQRLWSNVTDALRDGDINRATEEKFKLEDIQRVSEQTRNRLRIPHIPKYFQASTDGWIYKKKVEKTFSEN